MVFPPFRIAIDVFCTVQLGNLIFANHRDLEFPVGFVTVHIS